MKRVLQLTAAALLAALLGSCASGPDNSEEKILRMPKLPKLEIPLLSKEAPIESTVDFNAQIRPILETRCLACHNSKNTGRGLNLETNETANSSWRGGPVIMPEHPERSMLYQVLLISSGTPNDPHVIPASERFLINTWIKEGAYWPDGALSAR